MNLFYYRISNEFKMNVIKPQLEVKAENEVEVSESFLASDDHINFSKKIKVEKQDEDEKYFVALGIVESQHEFSENKKEITETFEESLPGYVKFDFFQHFHDYHIINDIRLTKLLRVNISCMLCLGLLIFSTFKSC